MSKEEVELAIHTDSAHVDQLRSMYSSKETTEHGYLEFKCIGDAARNQVALNPVNTIFGNHISSTYSIIY